MRAYVFTDRSLARLAGRFVWLSLDMEKAKNASARRHLGIDAFPTYYIVDPADGHVAIRWVGGASEAQLERLLADGELAVRGSATGPAMEALVRADRLYGASDYKGAAAAYASALAEAPPGWAARDRALEAELFALQASDQNEAVVKLAVESWPAAEHTASAATVASSGLDGAVQLPKDHAGRADRIAQFERACREALADTTLAGDDRSGLYFSLEGAREEAGDTTAALALIEAHAAMLEHEAAKAATPDARAVYDSHRLSCYLGLHQPERALPMLERSEQDLPDDYDPPARLSVAYAAMQRWPEALAANDRALAKAYGPRQFLVYTTRADIYLGMRDTTAARRTLAEAVAKAGAMPEGLRSERTIAGLRKRLAALPAATP